MRYPSKRQFLAYLASVFLAVQSGAQQGAVQTALAALQSNDFASAERILKNRLRMQPRDPDALGVLAVVLDQDKKFSEAEDVYDRALAVSPHEPALLNNFGNHLVASGKFRQARETFLKVVNQDPGNANALVQLAKIALQNDAAQDAAGYLQKLPIAARSRPDAVILTMQADYLTGHKAEADALLAKASAAEGDPDASFRLATALASARQYQQADAYYAKALNAKPHDFDVLYGAGLAAAHSDHDSRALKLLQDALTLQPQNVSVLYDLAAVNLALDDKENALALLAQAGRLEPTRTDVLQLEARTAAALGYFADAVRLWGSYLKLVPADAVAARERAFAQSATGENLNDSITVLTAYARQHPADAAGHYELGTAQTTMNPEQALAELNRALILKPDLTGAHVARGLLLYRRGNPESAKSDFEFAAAKEPKNAAILDRLGETYMALGRTDDALPLLRKAAELQPSNSTVLLHLGRALSKAGQRQQADEVFARTRSLGPNRSSLVRSSGLVEFLSLSPEEQRERYRTGVTETVQHHPENAEAQVNYLGILLDENRMADAAATARQIAALHAQATLIKSAADMLLTASQYATAVEFLKQADGATPDLLLDRAIAEFHVTGAETGLTLLSTISEAQRNGDYYLARAEMLESQKQFADSDLCLERVASKGATRLDLFIHAISLLLQHNRVPQARKLLAEAQRTRPNDPGLSLLGAFALELAGSRAEADLEFTRLQNRWPDWDTVWLANALVLDSRQQHEQAASMRQVAVALGSSSNITAVNSKADLAAALPLFFP